MTIFGMGTGAALAQAVSDSQAWIVPQPEENETGSAVRWRLTTESASRIPVLVPDTSVRDRDVSAIASQVDFYPFGDEFYLSAGTIAPVNTRDVTNWSLRSDNAAYNGFPHAELREEVDQESQIEQLTRYFGAGVTVQTIDSWSLTVEGGAYFGDGSEDQMVLYDPDTGEQMTLLEDLDKVGNDAIGDRHARSVRPVAHLVLRRRF